MKNYIITIAMLIFLVSNSFSQENLKGNVFGLDENDKKSPLVRASVQWLNTGKGVLTGKNGEFSLQKIKSTNKLVVSFVGYKTDTLTISSNSLSVEINLKQSLSTDEIRVEAEAPQALISTSSVVNSVTITEGGLQKAACCNLAESFVTNAAADVEYSDAMSGARQIMLLGLKGTYTQLQAENVPSMRGLATAFGLGYVPGPWMESISISKGTSSVVNGFESITGQINVEFKKPENNNPTHFNVYGDHLGRMEVNSYGNFDVNEKLSTMMLVHANTHQWYHDLNNDSFIDHPQVNQVNLMNRWKYIGETVESVTAANFVYEDRQAGQREFLFNNDRNYYGMDIQTTRLNAFTKNGFLLDGERGSSIGTILSFTHHNQESFYGINTFNAQHNSMYANVLFATGFFKESHDHNHHEDEDDCGHEPEIWHKLTAGASFQYDNYFHTLNGTNGFINEYIPGVFTEYSFIGIKDVVLTGGLRADYHNQYGEFFTPRFHAKYSPDDLFTLRLSAGRGSRTPYAIAENSFVLASSREIIMLEDILREEANSYGISFTSQFDFLNTYFTFNADFFRTEFVNQLIVDMDRNAQSIYFYNLDGESFSNSFQVDLIAELTDNLIISTAYRFNEVKMTMNGELLDKPFQNFHKGFFNIAYSTANQGWSFDMTVEYNGGGRIPHTHMNPEQYRLPTSFDAFYMVHGHITKRLDALELYLGAENIFDFVQANPIIAANDPFGNYFDSSMIWGPIIGRKIYIGARYNIK
ncbi:MAG: TonB-dependent receptor [Candidatus Kapabacteria bacterium]|nr:TonB-dependent receptor [Ignavibacteriota bacterium]MCW5883614.1 TonB-dependent receptor [Candidatus Kapabacteria bacterium]